MTNENAVATKQERAVEFVPFGAADKIKLTVAIVQNIVAVPTRSGKTCSERDAMKFIMLCQAQRLNPFAGDAYLVGYDGQNGANFSLITAHQAFLKRAEVSPDYDGMESGIIISTEDGGLEERQGDFYGPDERVVGGWAKVYHRNRKIPTYRRIRMERFNKGMAQWKEDAAGMIVKCAEADALRSTFPTMMGGLYLREETSPIDVSAVKVEVASPNIPAIADSEAAPQPRATRTRKTTSAVGEPATVPQPEPAQTTPAADSISNVRTVKEDTINALIENGVTVDDFTDYLTTYNIFSDAKSCPEFESVPSAVYDAIQGKHLALIVKKYQPRN